ncbi:MAG: hypothetical protein H6737_12185 [Alphaproteobacteria bacterium]|nr:hypothetical protein [Alphaproteobacteria bacterium]
MSEGAFTLDYESLKAFCDRQGLAYFTNDALDQIAIPRPDRRGWALRLVPRPEKGMLTIAYPLPGHIPQERMAALAASANLMNARTFMGAWVVNWETSEMYFRETVPTQGVEYTDDSVRELLQIVIGTVELMVPRLDAVLKGAEPEAVLEESNA